MMPMQRTSRKISAFVWFGLAAAGPVGALLAQVADVDSSSVTSSPRPEALSPAAAEGFWPTPELLQILVARVAAESAQTYELRPDQAAALETRLLERWKSFLDENRRELEPLIGEYMRARSAPEPPSADRVAGWAARAMSVFRRLERNVAAGEREVRELLDEEQKARFDAGRARREEGMRLIEGQLKRWSVGNFRVAEWWDPPADQALPGISGSSLGPPAAGDESGPIAAIMQRATEAADLPPRIATELAAWELYVVDFCERYDLDLSQRKAAASILRELTRRCRDHVFRYRQRIAALEVRISTGAGEHDEAFERELQELYGPIDRMFQELAARLDKLPTEGQRHRVQGAQDAPDGGE